MKDGRMWKRRWTWGGGGSGGGGGGVGSTRYCLSADSPGGVQLLGNHRGAEDGKDPAVYP